MVITFLLCTNDYQLDLNSYGEETKYYQHFVFVEYVIMCVEMKLVGYIRCQLNISSSNVGHMP